MSLPAHIRLIREISRSSIATVWEGYDERLQRKVLVKSLHPQLARDSELRVRFEREARTVASLAHPNIVRIYELHSDEEQLSLVFEFVEGQTLRELLKTHKMLPADAALAITHEMLAGLAAAHEKGIIHRDLKPENVLLSKQGEAKITDFGWAIVRDLPRLTLDGALVGTPEYMAPEQAAGEEVTPRTDLFALGLMLFEMLTGQTALRGRTWQECLQELVRYQPPRFSDYREKIPPELEHILARLLDRNPARRFENATTAHEALEAVASQWLFSLAPDTLRDFIAHFMTETPSETEPAEKPKTRRSGRYAMIVALAMIFLTVFLIYKIVERERRVRSSIMPDTRVEAGAPAESVFIEEGSEITSLPDDSSEQEEQATVLPETKPPLKPPEVEQTTDDTTALSLVSMPPETVRLWIHSEPATQVEIDGRKIGWTPLEERLLTGNHRITFPVERFPVTPETIVGLKQGKKTDTLSINLYHYVGVIDTIVAQPWAIVYLDGAPVDTTPGARPLFMTLNDTHTVRLEHPEYPPWERQFFFQRGDPPQQIRVDLRKKP
ncbi:MAG: serine/threonine protein kinase [Calditrichaeota bacterium]|nr:serine/threonine protein kinase [Calditrichota bacterium]